jgi:hypothetical protein
MVHFGGYRTKDFRLGTTCHRRSNKFEQRRAITVRLRQRWRMMQPKDPAWFEAE